MLFRVLTPAAFCLLSIPFLSAQKRQPDKIILKNTEVQTGKIIEVDADHIRLRKADDSETLIPFGDIDSVTGLSYRTRFIAGGLGLGSFNYYSPYLFEDNRTKGGHFLLRAGRFKNRHRATFGQLSIMPGTFTVTRIGVGGQYHIWQHSDPVNAYIGVVPELNLVANNPAFVTFSGHVGASFLAWEKVRFFAEATWLRPVFNISKANSFNVQIGIRLNREFWPYYKALNNTIRP